MDVDCVRYFPSALMRTNVEDYLKVNDDDMKNVSMNHDDADDDLDERKKNKILKSFFLIVLIYW